MVGEMEVHLSQEIARRDLDYIIHLRKENCNEKKYTLNFTDSSIVVYGELCEFYNYL